MSGDIVPIKKVVEPGDRRWRHKIPQTHCSSLDTRLAWLWNQRFGTLQTVYKDSPDLLDRTAATLVLQAIMAKDLRSIQQLFQRLEGGTSLDQDIVESEALRI